MYELSSVAEDGTSKRVVRDKGTRSCILDKLAAARSYAASITACFIPLTFYVPFTPKFFMWSLLALVANPTSYK